MQNDDVAEKGRKGRISFKNKITNAALMLEML